MPRTKRTGRAQPAWKIQVARTSSSPTVRAVGGCDGAVVTSLADADNGGGVAMIVTQVGS